jgi:hypothetical protein
MIISIIASISSAIVLRSPLGAAPENFRYDNLIFMIYYLEFKINPN